MKKTTKRALILILLFFTGKGILIAQELHTRNNGASQNSVVIIRSDNSGDQNQNQTSDLDFQIWDSNTRLNIPQGRIGMIGEDIGSQAKEASGRMAFYTTNEAYPSPILIERMRIDQNGNIGIGTTNPNSKLQIQGQDGEQQQGQIHIVGNGESGPGDAYISFFEGAEVNSKWSIGVKDNDNAFSISSGLTMDVDPKLIIKEGTGNVGIGTTAPLSKFQVEDINAAGEIGITIKNKNASIGTKSVIDFITTTTDTKYGSLGVENTALGAGAMTFSTRGGEAFEKMRITSSGNVGIGTGDTKGFKLGVKGQIAAQEVKVALYDNWSDFVFKKEYYLPTLKEVEKHIKEKGHLKDIPSAKEVAENGFYLGEMDSKLLQKIEELTLYTIQQEKEIIEQKEKVKKQAREIEFLKSLAERLTKVEEQLKKKN